MSNLIRQQLLMHGSIVPAINTKGEARADSHAIRERQRELVGRKVQRACSILEESVRREKREANQQRREKREWK